MLAEPLPLIPRDVAARFGVSLDTVLGWIRRGDLEAVNVAVGPGHRWRISEAAVSRFRENRTTKPSAAVEPRRRVKRRPKVLVEYV